MDHVAIVVPQGANELAGNGIEGIDGRLKGKYFLKVSEVDPPDDALLRCSMKPSRKDALVSSRR